MYTTGFGFGPSFNIFISFFNTQIFLLEFLKGTLVKAVFVDVSQFTKLTV